MGVMGSLSRVDLELASRKFNVKKRGIKTAYKMHKEVVSRQNSKGPGIERIVAVDWSGRVDVAGQRRHIWAGVWTTGSSAKTSWSSANQGGSEAGKVTLETGRTRAELIEWLIELGRETPRMVVGLDCCFSYPAWFLEEHGCLTVFEFWQQVAAGKGETWLHRDCEDVRFWGKAGSARMGRRPEEFCGVGTERMMRQTDLENKIVPLRAGGDAERAAKMKGITAKSPFQIGGSGSVGTGSLRAMPALLRLREAGFRIWPFEDAALSAESPRPLVIEMYTRLLTGAVAKSNGAARKTYLARRREEEAVYAGLSRGVMAKALGSEDGFDALVSALEMARWREEFAGLRRTKDAQLRLEGITWRPGVGGSVML
jgi:hypothetical protein